jgi:hypothetical protein
MDRLERRTFDGMVTWFCRYNVLAFPDYEDEKKISALGRKSKDSGSEELFPLGNSEIDPFAESKDRKSEVDSMTNDMTGNRFIFDF